MPRCRCDAAPSAPVACPLGCSILSGCDVSRMPPESVAGCIMLSCCMTPSMVRYVLITAADEWGTNAITHTLGLRSCPSNQNKRNNGTGTGKHRYQSLDLRSNTRRSNEDTGKQYVPRTSLAAGAQRWRTCPGGHPLCRAQPVGAVALALARPAARVAAGPCCRLVPPQLQHLAASAAAGSHEHVCDHAGEV